MDEKSRWSLNPIRAVRRTKPANSNAPVHSMKGRADLAANLDLEPSSCMSYNKHATLHGRALVVGPAGKCQHECE